MSINVANAAADLDGKFLVTREDNETLTGLKSFDRGTNVPFVVSNASAAMVANLDANKTGGFTAAQLRDAGQLTGTLPNASVPNPLPGVSGENLTSLIASRLTNWVVQTKTAAYVLVVTDDLVRFTTAGVTLVLPPVASVGNKEFAVSNEAASGVIDIDPNASETIADGIAAKTVTYLGPGETMRFRAYGTGWVVTGRNGFVSRCEVSRITSGQAIPTATETKIQFNSENYDRFAEFDATTNYQWTAIEAMEIVVHVRVYFNTAATAPYLQLFLNAAPVVLVRSDNDNQGGPQLTWRGRVAAGDTILAKVAHSTGADRNVYEGGFVYTGLSIARTL